SSVIIFLPWQLYILHEFPAIALWEYHYNSMHIWFVLTDHNEPWYYHFDYLRMNFGELIYIPVIWFTVSTFRKKDAHGIAVLLWFWVPYIFFSFCATKMQAYTLFAAPAIFI